MDEAFFGRCFEAHSFEFLNDIDVSMLTRVLLHHFTLFPCAPDDMYFVKIDVEGGEKLVLEGASDMLKRNRIRGGVFEVGETLKDAGTSAEEIASMLEGFGYKVNKDLSHSDWYFHL